MFTVLVQKCLKTKIHSNLQLRPTVCVNNINLDRPSLLLVVVRPLNQPKCSSVICSNKISSACSMSAARSSSLKRSSLIFKRSLIFITAWLMLGCWSDSISRLNDRLTAEFEPEMAIISSARKQRLGNWSFLNLKMLAHTCSHLAGWFGKAFTT